MTDKNNIDYGPLTGLIGVWKGDKGVDIAPEPNGSERNLYHEIITYTAIGNVTNAKAQTLSVLHYRQLVSNKSNNEIFHDETGYWMWDPEASMIMHSLVIPRGVCVLAGGVYKAQESDGDDIVLKVSAHLNDKDWKIIQSPFMQEKACTTGFRHELVIRNKTLTYAETTTVEIYGKVFEHTDNNELQLC